MTDAREPQTPEQRLAAAREWAGRVEPAPAATSTAGGEMGARVQTVIEAAERAADAIRYDAEEQAQRHLAEAQQKADRLTAERVRLISQLTDDLIEHASIVREHSETMVSSLEQAIETVTKSLAQEAGTEGAAPGASEPAPRAPTVEAREVKPPPAPGSAPKPPAEAQSPEPEPEPSAAALLRATQLAVAGRERDEIARTITKEFGIDSEPVLARVLG